jgi:hypothetical protein
MYRLRNSKSGEDGWMAHQTERLCIISRGIMLPLRSRMRDWKPVIEDEIYVDLALFMLMGIIQKPTLCSYF